VKIPDWKYTAVIFAHWVEKSTTNSASKACRKHGKQSTARRGQDRAVISRESGTGSGDGENKGDGGSGDRYGPGIYIARPPVCGNLLAHFRIRIPVTRQLRNLIWRCA